MNAEAPQRLKSEHRVVFMVVGIGFFGLAALLGFSAKSMHSENFPVRFVRVQGEIRYLDKAELEARLVPLLESGYWDLNLESVRRAAEKHPWVESVQTQRIWPDTVVLSIEEYIPLARFGKESLISARGRVFSPARIKGFENLPLIEGPAAQAGDLLTAFREMEILAKSKGLIAAKLLVAEHDSWLLETTNGLRVELGRDAPVTKFKRFVDTLVLLDEQQIQSMVRVDLRYRNGYAVEWLPGTEPEWASYIKRSDPSRNGAARSI